jgi:hypothetical protein
LSLPPNARGFRTASRDPPTPRRATVCRDTPRNFRLQPKTASPVATKLGRPGIAREQDRP